MQFNKWISTALLLLTVNAGAQTLTPEGEAAIDRYLQEQQMTTGIPGMVALIVNKDGVIFEKAYGRMDVTNNKPMTQDAIFRIASMTKPITSTAIMMLVEDGKIELDAPLSQYVPELGDRQVFSSFNLDDGTFTAEPAKNEITIRHLLTNTSGLGYAFVSPELAKLSEGKPGARAIDFPLLFEPGTQWVYGESTRVLGTVIERVTGQGLFEFMQSRILGPLQMNDTSFDIPADKNARTVTVWRSDGSQLLESPNPAGVISSPVQGDGGLSSTARDYAQFIRLFLNDGSLNGQQLLKPETIALMGESHTGEVRVGLMPTTNPLTSQPFPLGAGVDTYGLGFQRTEGRVANMRSPGSLAWAGIFNTEFWIDPQREVGAVLMMQFMPFYHQAAINVLQGFEEQVYTNLEK
ncbi:MAG: serine hydrolase domain-containing protein [Pseudomonadota bacterium]